MRESSLWSAVEIEVPFEEISESVTRVGFRSKRWGIAAAVCVVLTLLVAVAFLATVFERRRAFLRDKFLTALASARHPRAQLAAELRALGVFDESEIEVLAARLSQPGGGEPDEGGPGSSGGSRMPN